MKSVEVHVEAITWTVRFYPDGGGYPGPFIGVCTVQAIGSKAITISAMHGAITKKHLQEGARYFYDLGYRNVIASRHGKIVQRKIEKYLSL